MIKAVIFDVDGVLLDSFEANLKFYQNLMKKAGYQQPTRKKFPKIFHLSLHDAIKALTKSKSDKEIKRIWEMGRSREVEYPLNLLTMPESSADIIKKLSKKYFLGIVTSRVRSSTYEAPALSKLKKYFQVTVSYEDTTNHKPHPEPLLLACQKLKVSPANAVYIGDVESDIVAGKAAGMKVIIYSRDKFDSADMCTSAFTELPSLVQSL